MTIARRYWEAMELASSLYEFRRGSTNPELLSNAFGEKTMRKVLIASTFATLIGALAIPAFAADNFYVMFDKTAKKCSVHKGTPPTPTEQFSMMGQYGSEQEAMTAMHKMAECKG
jgi:hypothetical protein